MAVPASRIAAGPTAPGWGEYRRQMLAYAQDVKDEVAACLRAGGDGSAGPMAVAAFAIAVLLEAGEAGREAGRRQSVRDAELDLACARAVAEDRQAWPRPRGGHLRRVR